MKNSIKKVIAGLSVAAMFASAMPIVSALYDEGVKVNPDNDFNVVQHVQSGAVIEYVGPSNVDEIIVPEKIGDEKVVGFGDLAFATVSDDVTIYIPESVEYKRLDWEPFLTAGSINKGVLNVSDEEIQKVLEDENATKTPRNLIKYWGKMTNTDPEKLKDQYIDQKIEEAINKITEKATSLIPADLDPDKLVNQVNDIVNNIDMNIDLGFDPDKLKFDETLMGDLEENIKSLKSIKLTAEDIENCNIRAYEIRYDAYEDGMYIDGNQAMAMAINEEIQNKFKEIDIDASIKKVNDKISEIKAETEKIDLEETKQKALDSALGQIQDKVDAIKNDLSETLDQLKPEALEEKINDMIAGMGILNKIDTAPDKVLNLIDKVGADMDDSIVTSALKVVKDYKSDKDAFIENMDLSAANVARLEKAMNKLDQAIDVIPHTGVKLVVDPANKDIEEFETYTGDRGITFEADKPEPEAAPETSIVYSEVPGETSVVVSEVEGSTYTSIVNVPGETVTSIVHVTEPKQTVTSIVTSIVEKVSVSVSIETVYVTLPTTTKTVLEGDTDLDGEITLTDAVWIAEYILNKRVLTPDQFEAADSDNDGKVELNDAVYIAKIILQQMKK